MNIHSMLNWPDARRTVDGVEYQWPPFAGGQYRVSRDELTRLRNLGFDFVRLTVDPSIIISVTGDHRGVLAQIVTDKIRDIIDAGLTVVVDLHPVAVNPHYAPDALVLQSNQDRFESYAGAVQWMASILGPLPANRVVFELMNEPRLLRSNETGRWQLMLEHLHAIARAEAPSLPLVLTGAQWSSAGALLRVDPTRFRKSAVFYTFHYYDPHTFTHQGVKGEASQYLRGLRWPPDAQQTDAMLAQATSRITDDAAVAAAQKPETIAITKKLLADYVAMPSDPSTILGDFRKVRSWAAQHGVPSDHIMLGEFGSGWAVADLTDAKRNTMTWLRAVREAAETCGFPWAFWAYGKTLDPDIYRALGMKMS